MSQPSAFFNYMPGFHISFVDASRLVEPTTFRALICDDGDLARVIAWMQIHGGGHTLEVSSETMARLKEYGQQEQFPWKKLLKWFPFNKAPYSAPGERKQRAEYAIGRFVRGTHYASWPPSFVVAFGCADSEVRDAPFEG